MLVYLILLDLEKRNIHNCVLEIEKSNHLILSKHDTMEPWPVTINSSQVPAFDLSTSLM